MRDPEDPDDIDIDAAYREAARGIEDEAGAKRRRSAVLAAVQAAVQAKGQAVDSGDAASRKHRAAANEPRWRAPAAWWRGVAAACVLVSCTLLVLRLVDEPNTGVEAARDGTASPAGEAAPAERAAVANAEPPAVEAPATPAAPAAKAAPPAAAAPPAKPERPQRREPAAPVSAAPPATSSPPPATGEIAAAPAAVAERSLAAPSSPAPVAAASAAPAPDDPVVALARRPLSPRASADAARAAPPQIASGLAPMKALRPAPQGSLLAAVAAGDADTVARLLQTAAPDAERDADGRTALALAVLRSDARSVKLLLGHGSDRLLPDRFEQTPQGYAAALGDPAVLDAFGMR